MVKMDSKQIFNNIYLLKKSVLVAVEYALKVFSHIWLLSFISISDTAALNTSFTDKPLVKVGALTNYNHWL